MRKKIKQGMVCITLASVLLAGCRKSPDSSVVSNKDFDKLIEQAENTEGETTEVEELAENYDTYKTTIEDDTMHVRVNVDASVDIPQTDKLSIYRVEQNRISQELLDKVRTILEPDTVFYDGGIFGIQTKEQLEEEINDWKREIENLQNSSDLSEEDKQPYFDEYQACIDALQEKYENAPNEVPITEYPSDNQLQSVSSLYASNTNNSYYVWQNQLNPDGEIYYGVSDAKDGNYTFLYAQNNENYGNRLHYRTTKIGYPYGTPVVGTTGFDGKVIDYSDGIWEYGTEPDIEFINDNNLDIEEDTQETANLSEEEARKQADEFLQAIGLTDYSYYAGGLYYDLLGVNNDTSDVYKYRKEYIFGYRRSIDGVFACNEDASKFTDEYQGDAYVKRLWSGEGVTVIVNDNGIVGFDLCTPLTVTDTVVDHASLKRFDEIKDIFEQMIITTNATSEEEFITIDIDKVVLRYTRISEADSFDTGLLVPTWEFIGTRSKGMTYDTSSNEEIVVMSINAIDGSVINQELGY